jgi:TonB-dependent SusC/RagA subfamily outer membrane receptor
MKKKQPINATYGILLFLLLSWQPSHSQILAMVQQTKQTETSKNDSKKALGSILVDLEGIYRANIFFELNTVENIFVNPKIISTGLSLEENLENILKPLGLTYKKNNKTSYSITIDNIYKKTSTINFTPAIINESEQKLGPQVKGRVLDENGSGLPGLSILIKGTTRGTSTDINGSFQLEVPTTETVLIFKYLGYETKEVLVGNQTNLEISLKPENKSLTEVVVTALGIKKQSKSVGYATASVGTDEMTLNRTANFMNALQGKMAGVNITPLGSGPAGTSKIRIRGQSSFGGNNSPLIVVNGVPIDNTNNGARGDVSERGSNRTSDGGDGLSSINPDDIEAMTVLKGAAASALYGSRAKDGVIMITTKTRSKGNGISLAYNSNFTSETPLDYTDYQYEYGQGENGIRPTTPFPTSGQWSFGEKFQPGMTQMLFDGVTLPYEPQRNQISQFYRQGYTWTNTLTLTSGGENGGFSLSVANLDNRTILQNSGYDRKTINLGFTQTL